MPILDQFFSTADFNLSRSIAQVPEAFDQKLHPMNAPALARVSAYSGTDSRPHVKGKFIFLGDDKFYVRGVKNEFAFYMRAGIGPRICRYTSKGDRKSTRLNSSHY